MRALATTAVLAALVLTAGGCGTAEKEDSGEGEGLEKAADRSTCVADAHQVASYPAGFPRDFPFPDKTVVYHAEDRGQEGVIVTGVTSLPFPQVLAELNGPAQDAGFKVSNGETEEHDAEANWTGHGFRGRWAIRESAQCAGETVVQVLAAQD